MRKLGFVFYLLLIGLSPMIIAQDDFIKKLLEENKNLFGNVLENIESYEVQIIYTQINRGKNNIPTFTTYNYRVNPKEYFYPASTVKLPAAILALEKLNNLQISGLDKNTSLKIESARAPQSEVVSDSTAENYLPSIAHYIKKIFLVSDNDAFNRLYEFLGQKEFNNGLYKKGIKDVKIVHRLAGGFTAEENRYTNPFVFYKDNKTIFGQSEQYNNESYTFDLNKLLKGVGYIDPQNKLVNQPFDFSGKNYLSLEALTEVLKTVLFPEALPSHKRFNLSKDDYNFIYKYMSMLPKESRHPSYDTTYYDSYVKFLMFGDSRKPIDKNIRIFNKAGDAYGYLIDASYITDFENKIEFMLSAVIHVNKDQIFNDDKYEYDSVGIPFFANLGRVIYDYELKRVKDYLPDLSKFKINY